VSLSVGGGAGEEEAEGAVRTEPGEGGDRCCLHISTSKNGGFETKETAARIVALSAVKSGQNAKARHVITRDSAQLRVRLRRVLALPVAASLYSPEVRKPGNMAAMMSLTGVTAAAPVACRAQRGGAECKAAAIRPAFPGKASLSESFAALSVGPARKQAQRGLSICGASDARRRRPAPSPATRPPGF
jgi:hypothetical protein